MAQSHLWASTAPASETRSCFCVGPQNGDPVCPCQMPAYRQREADRADADAYRLALREGRIVPPAPGHTINDLSDDSNALASAGYVEE